jgi:pilus assembly protein Flp/PilA
MVLLSIHELTVNEGFLSSFQGIIGFISSVIYTLHGEHAMFHLPSRFWLQNEEGQGLVEYAFILILVALVVLLVLLLFGPEIGNLYSSIVDALP